MQRGVLYAVICVLVVTTVSATIQNGYVQGWTGDGVERELIEQGESHGSVDVVFVGDSGTVMLEIGNETVTVDEGELAQTGHGFIYMDEVYVR